MTPISRQIINYALAQAAAVGAALGLQPGQVHLLTSVQTPVESLPDVNVWTVEDRPREGEEETDSAGGQVRVLTFASAITVKSLDEADTDPFAVSFRRAILSDPTLGGLVLNTVWAGQEWGEGNTSAPTVSTKLTFRATYNWSPEW